MGKNREKTTSVTENNYIEDLYSLSYNHITIIQSSTIPIVRWDNFEQFQTCSLLQQQYGLAGKHNFLHY